MYPIVEVFGIKFGSYGIMMMLGILLAVILSFRRAKKFGVNPYDVIVIGAVGLLCGLLGAKFLYIFVTYPFDYIIDSITSGNFDFITGGGLVFYGGIIGGIIGALVAAYFIKQPMAPFEATVVPFLPLAHALGRIGCLLGGCCHGMPYEGPMAVYYPNSLQGLPADQGYFPVQPVEALWDVLLCLMLLWAAKKPRRKLSMLAFYMCLYAVGRFTLEYFRGDEIRGISLNLSTSQWISIGLLVVCVPILVYNGIKCKKQ